MIYLKKKNISRADVQEIDKMFRKHECLVSNTIELNNFIITYEETKYPGDFDERKEELKEDIKERNWVYNEIDTAIKKVKRDLDTRKAIFYNLYDSGFEHNCLNVFQLCYRNKKLSMNVYVRSMDFDKNFNFDLYTFNMLLNKACNELMLDKGQITVFITSLHKYI